MTPFRSLLLLLSALAACLAAPAPPILKDPPIVGWPMLGGNASRNLANPAARGLLDDWSVKKGAERGILWSAALGSNSHASPVVAGGRVFIGTNNERPRNKAVQGDRGVMMCFRQSDGEFLWQAVHDKLPEGDATDVPRQGVASTPCVEGERLYYVSNRCELVCADVGTGKAKWTLDMRAELDVFPCQLAISSPLVVGELVFVLTGHGVDVHKEKLPARDAASFIAVEKKTGKVAWTSRLPGRNIMRGQWSSPAAAVVGGRMQIHFAGGDGWLYGLGAEKGELLWKFNLNPKSATPYKAGGSGEKCFPLATPVVHGGKCYIACGQEPDDGSGVGHLWCIDIGRQPTNRETDLSPMGGDFNPKSAANKDSGLVWHYGGRKSMPKEDETEWVFGRTISTVAVHDGLVYASELAGVLHCLDAKTGEKLWEHDFLDSTWCSPYYANGKVYLGTGSGDLLVFQAGRKESLLRKIPTRGVIKSPPVAVGNVLYLSTGNMLYAIGKR